MNYAQIRKMDLSDGPGVRVAIYVQGCSFHCEDCFNSSTWNFEEGKLFTNEVFDQLIELGNNDITAGLSILGGEPLHPKNVDTVVEIAKRFKETYPNKNVWCWTGYLYENLSDQQQKVLPYLDVLVDGQYQKELKDFRLMYRGSSNQRVIDIKKTLENKEVTQIQGI